MRPSHADPQTIEWTVTRPPEAASCPDANALTAAVAKARGSDPAPLRAPRAIALEVAFAHEGAEYTATVRTRGPGSGVRTLSGPSCGAVADAVVAAITVLLDDVGEDGAAPPEAAARPDPRELPPEPRAPEPPYHPLRIGLAAHAGAVGFHRSESDPTSRGGAMLGGELRVHPYSQHGVAVAMSRAGGLFGPNVTLFDAAYSYALIDPRPLHGVSAAVYLDVGPALGLVSRAGPSPDHAVLGGRASITADLQLSMFTIGASAGYRGGVPLSGAADAWEGVFTAMLRLGVVVDLGTRKGD